jgi:diacylglycerol kinase (ATP)
MRVTLIHNPGAGDSDQPDAQALQRYIREAGHEVLYQPCTREHDWAAALDQASDLVAIAGGDGTVGRVAKEMIGRGVPIAAIPMGTANNISRTLGLLDWRLEDWIRSWQDARRQPYDAGTARGPWGMERFIEALGIGLFAWTMPAADESWTLNNLEDADAKVTYAIEMVKDRLRRCPAMPLQASLDGKEIAGDFVLFEAMIMQYVGPNLFLGANSEPSDGCLDLVLVGEAEREKLLKYLSSWQKGRMRAPDLPTLRGRHLKIQWTGFEVHMDDQVWPEPGAENQRQCAPGDIEVLVQRDALEFLVPA